MRLGILQTGHAPDALRPEHGDYSDLFEQLLKDHGFDFRTWNVVDMEFPEGPGDADAWLITGSKHGAYEDHPWIAPLEGLICDIHDQKRPLVGICFGHQIIAQALGGKVEKFRGGWAVGRQIYDFEGEALALNAWHQDQVTERPEGARPVASSAFCENAALAYGDHILTVQPHPEFDARFIRGLIDGRGRGVVPDDRLAMAEEALERPTDSARVAEMLVAVLKGRVPA